MKSPVVHFSKITGKDGALSAHEEKVYHKDSYLKAKSFLNVYENPEVAVINQVESQRLIQVKKNRDRITPIIESIIFLGRQNIPLRGHRDHGEMVVVDDECTEKNSSIVNEGNFRELLKFRVNSGDDILKEHLKEAAENATYISSMTQNHLIECCGEVVRQKMLTKIEIAKFYSISFDETTDLSHKSQMTLLVRFIDGTVSRDDFLGFNDLHDLNYGTDSTSEPTLTGEVIGKSVLTILVEDLRLNPLHCVGIGTDGCSVMSSILKGAVVEIQKVCVNSVWSPCYNHALNLTLSKTSQVQVFRNCMGTTGAVLF